jgi:hypothetical protein
MRRLIVAVLVFVTVLAAGFSRPTSVSAMVGDMHGHVAGFECLVHCLSAGSADGVVAAAATPLVGFVAAAIVWFVAFPSVRPAFVLGRRRVPSGPGRRFLIARLD